MDLSTLIPASGLAGVGVGGLLVMLVGYLLVANRTDRREYQEAIDKAEARADAAEKRTAAAEVRIDSLQQVVDEVRAARRAAEDRVAVVERELARYRPDGGGP